MGVCVIDDQRTWTGARLVLASLMIADRIRAAGASGAVAVALPTSGLFPAAALAAWMTGRAVVPINYMLGRQEVRFILDDSGADTLITVGPMLEHMGHRPAVRRIIELDKLDRRRVPEVAWPEPASDDDTAALMYTSGTSGRPKGVIMTHGNLLSNVRQACLHIRFDSHHRLLGCIPQFHSFGLTVLTLLPLIRHARVVYTARFVPAKIVRLFRQHRPTIFVGVPSMFGGLLHVKEAAWEDFASTRYMVSGGEPLPDMIADRFRERFGVAIAEGFGMTECGPVTNWCRPSEHRPRSVGPALPMVRVRVVDPATERVLPPGREGEVRFAGPNVTRGYHNRPEENARLFDSAGFLRSGDIGRIDAQGHLSITGRLKEMLIIAGENVFPREIEDALCRHPSVKDAGVIGVADPLRGESPVGFVELHEGAAFDADALRVHCKGLIAAFKVPSQIRRVDALPRSPTGKVLRRALRGMLAEPGAGAAAVSAAEPERPGVSAAARPPKAFQPPKALR